MMRYNNSCSGEECPLTKSRSYKYTLTMYCGDGLKFIISCFTILTISITTTLILQILYADGNPQNTAGVHGAVATDYTNCSQIGTKILRKGGNAIDAAIAATICMTVVAPHKTGLGGGGYMMLYNHKEQTEPIIIDFANNTIKDNFLQDGIRIPAVLRGLEYAHTLKGKLPWSEIVKPSVSLAKEGFVVSKELASEVSKNIDYEILYGHISAGDILKLHDLSNLLNAVGLEGTNVLYNGTFSQKLLHDRIKLSKLLPQLVNYKPDVYIAKKSSFYKHVIYYPPHMSLLKSMIAALEDLNISTDNASIVGADIQIAKTLINSVSMPLQLKQLVEEERYTGVVAMDWEDTYVCIMTGLGAPFGLGYMSTVGFLLDKADTNNTLSMLVPIIFHNEKALCGLRGVFGTDDTLIVGQLLYSIIVRQLNISEAIEYPRYYFSSDGFVIENDSKHSIDTLMRNQLNLMVPAPHLKTDSVLKSVNAIIKRKDLMSSHSDSRGGGLASRF
ncbi:glutathione hydrolase 7-like isoform X2 [Bombus pascuorum]|uniref:glutathione hydrolase 7-like isoform X2 n=1 Tax=Bombus pascuorum TaxID=65598 RepID=UPI0021413C96|nr:glutathione hydrolase 7-like isoform X2 [Bombus pascuorum]